MTFIDFVLALNSFIWIAGNKNLKASILYWSSRKETTGAIEKWKGTQTFHYSQNWIFSGEIMNQKYDMSDRS